jgi:hypothetical protein
VPLGDLDRHEQVVSLRDRKKWADNQVEQSEEQICRGGQQYCQALRMKWRLVPPDNWMPDALARFNAELPEK